MLDPVHVLDKDFFIRQRYVHYVGTVPYIIKLDLGKLRTPKLHVFILQLHFYISLLMSLIG